MKIIDLLNKIANGEIEDKTMFKITWNDMYRECYYDKNEDNELNSLKNISDDYPLYDDIRLDDEIEIISKPTTEPTIEDLQTRIDKAKDYLETCMINPEDLSLYENITKEECLKLLEILRGEE